MIHNHSEEPLPEDVGKRGSAIYEHIKGELEIRHANQFVAIHVDTGDFAVARSTAEAMRALRERRARGPLFLRKIGSEPEFGLAARMLTGEMFAAEAERRK